MWSANMPANIALIKYMGKTDVENNLPSNASLSWTLGHLKTRVSIEPSSKDYDTWHHIKTPYPFHMSEKGYKKFLGHFHRVKEVFGVTDHFMVSSGNNFPADCGIASSASSFAALTEAACIAFEEKTEKSLTTLKKAMLSSKGSGSSCRSFMKGWVLWENNNIKEVPNALNDLYHMVILAGDKAKKVSSSEAHKLVATSTLFPQRVERAESRLKNFIKGLEQEDWNTLFQISWEEFWDMHALFETSQPPFGYFLPQTVYIHGFIRNFWEKNGDGPLVTMDAGPNVHFLWRKDQLDLAKKCFNDHLKNRLTTLSNIEEIGFAKV